MLSKWQLSAQGGQDTRRPCGPAPSRDSTGTPHLVSPRHRCRCRLFYELKARPSTSKLTLLRWSGPSPYQLRGLPVNALLSWRKTLRTPAGPRQGKQAHVSKRLKAYTWAYHVWEGEGSDKYHQWLQLGAVWLLSSGALCFLPVERGQGPS